MKVDLSPVAPAFQKNCHALIFVVLVFFFISLPVFLFWTGLPAREAVFAAAPSIAGNFPFLYRQIFKEKSEIDLLLLGGSTLWCGVKAPLVEEKLSAASGKPANVVTFGHSYATYDLEYYLLEKLLERRKIHLAILLHPNVEYVADWPHRLAEYWFTLRDWDMLSGAPLSRKICMYSQVVLGAPRRLLSLFRTDESGQYTYLCDQHGYLLWPCGFSRDFGRTRAPFTEFHPAPPKLPAARLFFSTNAAGFAFYDQPLGAYQARYFNQCISLLRSKGIPVVILHTPYFFEDPDRVIERLDTGLIDDKGVDIMGVPARILFNGLNQEQKMLLYSDHLHLNSNGAEFFTTAISEGIVHAYKKARTVK